MYAWSAVLFTRCYKKVIKLYESYLHELAILRRKNSFCYNCKRCVRFSSVFSVAHIWLHETLEYLLMKNLISSLWFLYRWYQRVNQKLSNANTLNILSFISTQTRPTYVTLTFASRLFNNLIVHCMSDESRVFAAGRRGRFCGDNSMYISILVTSGRMQIEPLRRVTPRRYWNIQGKFGRVQCLRALEHENWKRRRVVETTKAE